MRDRRETANRPDHRNGDSARAYNRWTQREELYGKVNTEQLRGTTTTENEGSAASFTLGRLAWRPGPALLSARDLLLLTCDLLLTAKGQVQVHWGTVPRCLTPDFTLRRQVLPRRLWGAWGQPALTTNRGLRPLTLGSQDLQAESNLALWNSGALRAGPLHRHDLQAHSGSREKPATAVHSGSFGTTAARTGALETRVLLTATDLGTLEHWKPAQTYCKGGR